MFEDDRYIAFINRCQIDVGGFPVDVRGSFVDTCASPALTLAGHGAESK